MTYLSRDTVVSIFLPQFGELPPAAWPKAVTYVLTAFAVIYFFQSVASRRADVEKAAAERDPSRQNGLMGWLRYYSNPIACFVLYFAFLYTLPFFGTLIGGSLLVFALLTLLGEVNTRNLVLHAVIAVVSVGAMWSLFTFGLRVLLPRGEIFPGI